MLTSPATTAARAASIKELATEIADIDAKIVGLERSIDISATTSGCSKTSATTSRDSSTFLSWSWRTRHDRHDYPLAGTALVLIRNGKAPPALACLTPNE